MSLAIGTRSLRLSLLFLLVTIPCVFIAVSAQQQQTLSRNDRDSAQDMLRVVGNDVRKHYYDPTFHGINWDANLQQAQAKIGKADSNGRAFSEIAAALDILNDSHTFFLPPQRAMRHEYGWLRQMIGDHCFVTRVRPGSDADAKGVKPGDEVLSINGFAPSRDNFWKMDYVYNVLRPQPGLRIELKDPAGAQRQADVMAKITETKRVMDLTGESGDVWDIVREGETSGHLMDARSVTFGDDLLIVKFPIFFFTPSVIDDLLGRMRKHKAVVLDLRGNPGGSVEVLKQFLGGVFENEIKIGDRVGRDVHKPMVTKKPHDPFTGKLVVLVDSRSASAAELFARVVQLEKRGVVMGDHSSGSVMEAKRYPNHLGTETMVFYGASITDADIIMSDGKSLEHTGVSPDEVALPTAADMAANRDPVLAQAAQSLGVKITPEKAGTLFPYEWTKD
jgi:carboxyl-terminal processing protease